MPYLNLDPNYFDHEKTKRLEFALGPQASIFPIRLWAIAAKSCPESGIFRNIEPLEIEHLIGWDGERGVCFAALERIGFLDRQDKNISIHKFLEHQGHLHAFRVRSIKANAKRWSKLKRNKMHPSALLEHSLETPPCRTLPILTKTIPTDKDIPPKIEDIRTYCQERGKGLDPEKFYDYYQSNGWRVGKNKMRDWRAAVRTWEKNQNGISHGVSQRIVGGAKPIPGKYDNLPVG